MISELKYDKDLPHHYLISVCSYDTTCGNIDKIGKMYLKHGPIHFTNEDIDQLRMTIQTAGDPLIKTKMKDALDMFGTRPIVQICHSMFMAAMANNASIHHFSSSFEIEDHYFETLVLAANKSEYERRKLFDARITGHRLI